MKRIFSLLNIIVLGSVFHAYSYNTAEMSFVTTHLYSSGYKYLSSKNNDPSFNKCNDYSFSSSSLDGHGGMRCDKSFDSEHYQTLNQAYSNHESCSLTQNPMIGFEEQIKRGELICVGNDSAVINDIDALRKISLSQHDLPGFYKNRDFLNNQINAINRTLNMPFAFKQEHYVTPEIREFFQYYDYDERILDKPYYGTYLQSYLHKECLFIFDTLAQVQLAHSSYELPAVYSAIADLGWAALSYNSLGKVKTASQLVQGCLMLLDCTSAVAYKGVVALSMIGDAAVQTAYHIGCGIVQGLDNVITVFCDPVQFLSNCAQTIKITAQSMLHAQAIGSQFSFATHMAMHDPDNAVKIIEEIRMQVELIMHYIDASVEHVAQMPAGKIIETATATVVEGMVWGAVGKLCRSALKTIPVITQAIQEGIAVGEIAITVEGIPVRIAAPKVLECMEVANTAIKAEKIASHTVEVIKRRGKQSSSYQKISASTHARPLNRLKGKDLIGIKDVSVRGYESLSKEILLDNYQHYLQPEIRLTRKGKIEPSGWHHDPGRSIEKIKRVNGHKIEIELYEKHSSGIYRFDWGIESMRKKTSTFFPHTWSRETVQKKIVEAYKYARKNHYIPEPQKNGSFAITGFTEESIKIKIIINQKGAVVTAYPVWP